MQNKCMHRKAARPLAAGFDQWVQNYASESLN